MFEKRNPMFIFMIPVAIMFIILLIWSITTLVKDVDEIKSTLAESDAIENIREGEIVDKLIINSQEHANVGVGVGLNGNGNVGVGVGVGGSTYVPMEYQFGVKGEYEYNGEKNTGERKIQVSEPVYNSYKIGEHFDSRNLKINDSSGGYNVIKTDSSGELVVEKHIKDDTSVDGVEFRVSDERFYTDENGIVKE